MATQKAELVNVFNYTTAPTLVGGVQNTQALSLVKDVYSGKYYGSDSYAQLVDSIAAARSFYQQQIEGVETPSLSMGISNTSHTGGSLYDSGTYLTDAKQALTNLDSFVLPTEGEYVQKPQMIESFNAHPEGWNKYFESAYKTPRLAEDNLALAQRQSEGKAPGNQLVASNLAIRSESGTGVGRESVGLNPFGKLDAGLNI